MKKILFSILLFMFFDTSYSQTSSLTIYTQTGENFYLYMNNTLQNDTAKSSVTVNDLNLSVYSMKIEFEDIYIEAIEKTLYVAPVTNSSYMIKKKTNGNYKILLVSQVSTNPQVTNNPNNGNNNNNQQNNGVDVTLWGIGIDLDALMDPSNYVDNGYNNGSKPAGCYSTMSQQNLDGVKQSISAKAFEDDKYNVAKQVAGSNCLKSSQVKEIMILFSFEDTKLKFAKFAYHHTSDLSNYYLVNDAFTFSTSIDELNNYINSLK